MILQSCICSEQKFNFRIYTKDIWSMCSQSSSSSCLQKEQARDIPAIKMGVLSLTLPLSFLSFSLSPSASHTLPLYVSHSMQPSSIIATATAYRLQCKAYNQSQSSMVASPCNMLMKFINLALVANPIINPLYNNIIMALCV